MVMAGSAFVLEPSVFAQNLDATKAGVVKITTKNGQVGTGFIVRVEQEVVYIITAAHVIAGDNQPEVEFFTKRNVPVKSAVLPGAELNDDLRGLALVVVRGKVHIPDGVTVLPFGKSVDLVAGGEEALVIGHPSSGGDWAILKRHISNRIGRDIALDPNVGSRFSGGPIIVGDHVVGIVMSRREGFGLGITHKSVLNYLEGFSVVPSPSVKQRVEDDPRGFQADVRKKESDSQLTLPETKTGKDGAPMVLVPAG
jgi:S1-C subfamily serine protease